MEQPADGDADQEPDEEELVNERRGERDEENRQEDVEHARLGELGADRDDFLAVLDVGPFDAFQLDVLLDELDGAVGPGDDRLHTGPAEPVDHRHAADDAQQERGVQDRQLVDVGRQAVGQQHDDREDQRRGTDDGRTDQHGFGGRLEGIAGTIVLFEQALGVFEVGVGVVVLANVVLMSAWVSISESSYTLWALSVTGP